MPMKWESFSQDSASAQQPAVPFGAPEGHFPDQLNNIQREALAAITQIGSAVFGGVDANGASTSATSVSDSMKQLLYDMMWPVNSMRMWDSNLGANLIATSVPSGVTATWTPCDGTSGTPDLRSKVLGGADPGAGTPVYTASTTGSGTTGSGGGHTPTGNADSHILTVAEMPAHDHDYADPGHTHTGSTTGDKAQVGGGLQGESSNTNRVAAAITINSSTTGITHNSAGGGGGHVHTLTMDAVAAHTHTIDPLRTNIEIYKRTA